MENIQLKKIKDVNLSEVAILGILSAAVLLFGFYPDPLFQTVNVSVDNLINNYNTDIQQNITLKK